jgi:hypothetical protein
MVCNGSIEKQLNVNIYCYLFTHYNNLSVNSYMKYLKKNFKGESSPFLEEKKLFCK